MPIIAAVAGVSGIIKSLAGLNHPNGVCAPNAADMQSFLACWKHAIPDNFMPTWTDMWGGSDGRGWVYCFGAKNGVPPATGCAEYGPNGNSRCVNGIAINPKTGEQITGSKNAPGCAPVGAIASVRGGGYQILPSASPGFTQTTAGKATLAGLAAAGVIGAFFLVR